MTLEDPHETRELEDELSVHSPKQRNIRLWNAFISIICLASVTLSLYELFFNSTVTGIIFTRYSLDLIFIFNIISRFYIGYETHGVVITDPKKVRKKYLRTWFLLDLLSVLPLETIAVAFPKLKFVRFAYANRCLRVFRLFGIISMFSKEPDTNKLHLTAFKVFSIMILCIQASACLWFHEVCYAAYTGNVRYCPKAENWLQLLPELSTNSTGVTDIEFYATSLYWSTITLCSIGYGDIHATNVEEATVASFVMVLGLLSFGISMSNMSSVIANMVAQRGKFYHRVDAILHYMRQMGLSEEIQEWVHKHYYNLWFHQKGRNIAGYMDDLPFVLHSDVSRCCYKTVIENAKLFKKTEDGFKRALSLKLKTCTYSPGQILVKTGEIHQNMYYIKQGLVQVLGKNPGDEIAKLLPGLLFGEVHLLYEIPRNVTICALTKCEIVILERKDLLLLFADYPEAAVEIVRAARKRLQNFRLLLREACAYGVASVPQNAVFEKDQSINLETKDQRIFGASLEYVLNQPHQFDSFWKRTFHPESAYVKAWRFFFFWCITVSVFLEMWVFFFTSNAESKKLFSEGWGSIYLAVNVLIYIVAAFDILMNLRTGVLMEDGDVTDLAAVFQVYRSSWNLYYDVLAILPLDLIVFAYGSAEHWAISGLVRLNRVIWIRRIYQYFCQKQSDIYKNLFEERTTKCLFFLIFTVHFCAGLLYLSACHEERCQEESWAWNAGLKSTQSNFEHYVFAVYLTVTTMTSVGYGDIVPGSLVEQCMVAVVGVIALLVFNYIISQLSATLSGENAKRVAFQNLFSEMHHFMKQHDLTVFLQNRVMNYMNLMWSKYQGEAFPGGPFLMHDLPVELKRNVLMAERGELLSQIPFFAEAGQSFIRDLALTSVMYFFPKGEIIQYSKTITRELFCIRRGACEILNDTLSDVVGHYQKGMHFGEAGFLFGKQATLTVRAVTCCEIVVIDFDKIGVLLEKYPLFKRQIKEYQSEPKCYKTMVETAEKLLKRQSHVQESDIAQRQKVTLAFQGRRFSKKTKCYVEDFGNIPMYAGSEEETVPMRRFKRQSPKSLMGRITYFFSSSCPSTFLMRNAILPSSAFYVRWEFFRSMLAVAVSIITSFLIAFLHFRMELWIVCYILGLFCWMDIYLRMHVAFYEDNDLKVDTLETAHHYVKTGFLVDFITCFPWELVGWIVISPFSENGFYANNETLHLYAYLRIPHIFQLYRIPFLFKFLQAGIDAERNSITVLMLLLYSAFSVHFATCITFASACPVADLHGNVSDYFLPLTKHNCTPLSWVVHVDKSFDVDFATVTFQQLYLISMYFATTTICAVGFGDIYPSLMAMKIGMTFIMIAAMLFTGWLSGTVTAMLANRDAMKAAYTEKTESIKLFLKSHKISGALYDSVVRFYVFRWKLTKGFDQDKLTEYLPSSLVGDISTVLYADFIGKVFGLNIQIKKSLESETHPLSPVAITKAGKLSGPLFEKMLTKECLEELKTDGCFIRLLARRISQSLFRANDLIYKKNDYGSEMYFIHKGEVEVLSKDNTAVLFKLKAGQYFGEKSLLLGEPRAATVRAATNCELYVLSKKSLDDALMYYPSIFKQMRSAADEMKYQLHKGDLQINTFKKPGSAGDTFLRTGSVKLYRENMAEEEHRAELRSRSLGTRLCTFISSVLIQFFSKIFNNMRRIHNKTIDPESNFRVIYQYTSCLLITIFFWSITFMPTVFDVDYYLFMLTMFVELLQIIEIFLKFRICYYDDSGTFISEYRSTSRNYMKRKVGFVFDMVFSFPYGLIIFHKMKKEPTKFLPMIIYVRIAHLPRIISLLLFMWKEEQSLTNNLLLIRMIKYFVHTFLFIHCAAVLCVSFVESHGIMSWVSETEIHDFTELYRYATYLILQIYTTTGYGDITASNFGEMIACVMIMILSKIQVIYKMGLLVAAQTNKMTLQEAFEEKLQTIQEHMMHEKVPSILQNRVMQFYSYQWNRTKGTCAEVLFKGVPRCLKMDIVSRICMQHLKKHHLFSHLREPVVRELSTRILFRCFPVGEFIYRKGDIATGMYLILIGKVNLCLDKRGRNVFQRLSVGAAFGDHFLVEHKNRDTAIATNYVDIAMLSKNALEDVALLCPSVGKLLKRASEMPQL
ncbi:cyclic nucleotide-gated cation channel alpha-3-like [Carassius carassius]|uniref:cyclic nucleotide-gated cation channel alpha-3-like n=1 Tax=Carassius carassius TaxID=217509 RepID=UPI0028695708|nr:cyclic nucleotide-gated cation channel alpha-3-like [Carassius carassius]